MGDGDDEDDAPMEEEDEEGEGEDVPNEAALTLTYHKGTKKLPIIPFPDNSSSITHPPHRRCLLCRDQGIGRRIYFRYRRR